MQTTSPLQVAAQIGRTDRPAASPLSQIVAKVLSAAAPFTPPEPVAAPAKDQRLSRPDGRDIRLGSVVDIRV